MTEAGRWPLAAGRWVKVTVTETVDYEHRQERRGRPAKDTRYRRVERHRFPVSMTADAEAVAYDAASARRALAAKGIAGLPMYHEGRPFVAPTAARVVEPLAATSVLHDDAMRLQPVRKHLHDAVCMATYNATSALSRLLAPHYRRADDEARMVLREALRSPAGLEVIGDELHVRINVLSVPRRSRAVAGLCKELNETGALYPGTTLRLVYSVKSC